MANHLVLIVSIAVVIFSNSLAGVAPNPVFPPERIPYTDESFPRDELIKVLQSQLRQKLNWSEADLETRTSPDLSEDEIELLMIGEEHQPRERVIARPSNKIFTCFGSEEYNCSRFEFVMTSQWERVESLFVWFRKKQRTTQLNIDVNFHGISDTYHYDESNLDVIIEKGRIGFNLIKPAIDQKGETVNFTIETRGSSVYEDSGNGPLLVISRTSEPTNARHRRSRTQRASTNCNCCVVDRTVTTSEMKMDKAIYYPATMNIKACRGTCRIDQSVFDNKYGTLMYSMSKHNASLMENLEEFWIPRCYPTKMRSMVIFYKDDIQEDIVHQVNVDDMVVESCSCMAYQCFSH